MTASGASQCGCSPGIVMKAERSCSASRRARPRSLEHSRAVSLHRLREGDRRDRARGGGAARWPAPAVERTGAISHGPPDEARELAWASAFVTTRVPGMLHGAITLRPSPGARRRIDTTRAAALPGVVAVTWRDVPGDAEASRDDSRVIGGRDDATWGRAGAVAAETRETARGHRAHRGHYDVLDPSPTHSLRWLPMHRDSTTAATSCRCRSSGAATWTPAGGRRVRRDDVPD